ncbi:MAG: YqgE/AlgH family protein [Nocardioidaceae bacterium]|nr:YqgE/AlgH family protein [Nocardioidaceae bacterium]NUS49677.1 YqgE/AlgH family protein [Nocardioidaceae bacterium]
MSEGSTRVEAGTLLVATPLLLDPNFDHTVVLMLDVDENGALGVVLNRPSTVSVTEILPEWAGLGIGPDMLFAGGPVGTDSALAVASLPDGIDEPVGFRRLYDDVGIVDLDTPTEVVGPALSGLRIFAGYAGWGEQQLIDEIRTGSWYVVPSAPGDVFGTDPGGLWMRVLRRQPGELAWVSTRPMDPTLN